MAHISVLGAGSWGTALAALLCENGHQVTLWSHREEQAEELRTTRMNSKLPGQLLPDSLEYTADLEAALKNRDMLIMAVPSKATRETAEKIKKICDTKSAEKSKNNDQGPLKEITEENRSCPPAENTYDNLPPVISVSKGIEDETLLTQSEIIEDVLPGVLVGVLSGPSHAEEVIRHLPTVVVAGAKKRTLAIMTQEFFMNENFRVYISPDVKGIEVGASLKNVIALAAGMSDGLGYGDNTKAALITRGIREITELAVAMGGKPETLAGLTGIGDLIVTCESVHSRNHRAGELIGQGMSMDEAMNSVAMVVEGVHSAKAALALGKKYDAYMPIITEVNHVLFDGKSPKEGVYDLMNRDKKAENKDIEW